MGKGRTELNGTDAIVMIDEYEMISESGCNLKFFVERSELALMDWKSIEIQTDHTVHVSGTVLPSQLPLFLRHLASQNPS
jgi:hypothetical protein